MIDLSELNHLRAEDIAEGIRLLRARLPDGHGTCATCRWAEEATGIWTGKEPPHPLACSLVRDATLFCIETQDDQGREELYVSPTFGCTEWEAKP